MGESQEEGRAAEGRERSLLAILGSPFTHSPALLTCNIGAIQEEEAASSVPSSLPHTPLVSP